MGLTYLKADVDVYWHMLVKALWISSDDISLMYHMKRERKEKQLLLLQYSHGSRGSKSQYNNVLSFGLHVESYFMQCL